MSIGKEFMKRTSPKHLGPSDQSRGYPQPPLAFGYDDDDTVIDLPAPGELHVEAVNLRELMEKRRSLRDYADAPLTPAELSYLLWCTQGVQEITNRPTTLRPVPSAGARHAFETYLLANKIDTVPPGLYRFAAIEHKLVEERAAPGIADKVAHACLQQEHVKSSAVTFIWTTALYRMTYRYGERGYRYLHLDAGHVCQNLYLAAESINCGACAVGAFDDEEINALLGFDDDKQFVVYVATVGKRG